MIGSLPAGGRCLIHISLRSAHVDGARSNRPLRAAAAENASCRSAVYGFKQPPISISPTVEKTGAKGHTARSFGVRVQGPEATQSLALDRLIHYDSGCVPTGMGGVNAGLLKLAAATTLGREPGRTAYTAGQNLEKNA